METKKEMILETLSFWLEHPANILTGAMQRQDILPKRFLHRFPLVVTEALQMVRHDENPLRHSPHRMVGFLMNNYIGRIATSVEAQITLEAAGGMFGVNMRQQDIDVRCDYVTIGALQPTFPAVGVVAVDVFVQLQMLLHEKAIVGRKRARPRHTFVQAHQRFFFEHAAAVLLVFGRYHVCPRFQSHGVEL